MNNFSDFGITAETTKLQGDKINFQNIINVEIIVEKFEVHPSKYKKEEECLHLQFTKEGERRILFIGSKTLIGMIRKVPEANFPFKTKIVIENKAPKFT